MTPKFDSALECLPKSKQNIKKEKEFCQKQRTMQYKSFYTAVNAGKFPLEETCGNRDQVLQQDSESTMD